jgi:hypothetical protein
MLWLPPSEALVIYDVLFSVSCQAHFFFHFHFCAPENEMNMRIGAYQLTDAYNSPNAFLDYREMNL